MRDVYLFQQRSRALDNSAKCEESNEESKKAISVTRAIEKFSDFLIVREPPLRSSVLLFFPEPGKDDLTRHAAQLYQRVEARVFAVIWGREMKVEDLSRMRDLLALNTISGDMIQMMPHYGMHARMQIDQLFRRFSVEGLFVDLPQVALVAAPHKTRRYMALFERWAPRYVAACVCPPQVSVAGFVPAEDAKEHGILYAQARMLACEVKEIESRLMRQQITLEGGVPSDLSALAERLVPETVADRSSSYS